MLPVLGIFIIYSWIAESNESFHNTQDEPIIALQYAHLKMMLYEKNPSSIESCAGYEILEETDLTWVSNDIFKKWKNHIHSSN